MTSVQISLPDDMLQRLVCQECFRYLSVPPTATNVSGEIICGRCFKDSNIETNEYTKSSYNLIAEGYAFKCINHYNKCNQLLSLSATEEHEKTCQSPQQECFFCSFSGVLSQILYHSLKAHPDNITHDGKLYLVFDNMTFQKKTIFVLNDDMFLITVVATDVLVTIEVAAITQAPPSIENQFCVKFFKPDDPSNVNYLHNDYGLVNTNLSNYFEKSKDDLIARFGPGVMVCCQILVGQFSLERELEFKQKFLTLSHGQEELNNLKKELELKEQDFLQETRVWVEKLAKRDQLYDSAVSVVKKLSWNSKCYSCQNFVLAEIYYCPKMHFYCIACLRNICKGCESMQEYKALGIGNFEVSCDWSGCTEIVCLYEYMEHKRLCIKRTYKCPKCVQKVSLKGLSDHWHCAVPLIIEHESFLSCEINESVDCYWVVKGNLYHVTMELDDVIRVLIEEFDVISNNVTFSCTGRTTFGQDTRDITFSNFCGKSVNIPNVNEYYTCIRIIFE